MIVYNKQFLKIAEFYYQPPVAERGLDIARCYYQQAPIEGTQQTVFHTLQIDLTQDAEQILAAMKKDNRQQIRYAERDGIATEGSSAPSDEWMQQFFAFYDAFAQGKGLPPANRARLIAMREANMLDLSRAIDPQSGETIVWHCTLLTPQAARLVHSASLARDAAQSRTTARANCWLHWQDIVRFREAGLATYDFGGWYAGEEDEAKLRINKFKESFGGKVVQLYNVDRGLTLRGAVAIRARHLLENWKERKN
ncbi:hypothetical protein F183_A16510 [Bryobacterales bacterium F-183]|nr:hypothetical protein F183_A16510 [Bryobacterales bacterium F-183]